MFPSQTVQSYWGRNACFIFKGPYTSIYIHSFIQQLGSPGGTVIKNLLANAGDARDTGVIPELERSPEVGNGNPLQHSCLENSTDRGAWQATVSGVAKSSKHTHQATYLSIHAVVSLQEETEAKYIGNFKK